MNYIYKIVDGVLEKIVREAVDAIAVDVEERVGRLADTEPKFRLVLPSISLKEPKQKRTPRFTYWRLRI